MNKRNVKYSLTIITLLVIMGCMFTQNVFAAFPEARSAEVGGEVFLGGDYLEIGISSSGSLGTDGNVPDGFHKTTYTDIMMTEIERTNLGLSIDKDGFDMGNPPTTGDFFLPANPIEGFMIGYYTGGGIGVGVKNIKKNINKYAPRLIDIPSTTTDISSGNLLSSRTVGVTNDGKIKNTQIISFNKSDKFYKTTVTLENVSDSDLYDIRYSRCVDPDQDADKNGVYTTNNEVIDNPDVNGKALVSALGPVTGEAFLYLSTDSRARTAITGTSLYDPYDATIYADDGSTLIRTANGHYWITITFNIGNLSAGESASFVYYSSLNPDAQVGITEIENVLPVDNEAPTISTNNDLTLNEGATKAITTTELSATDVDTDDTTLTYTITTGLSNGQLENTDNPGTPIVSFTQQNLIDGKIQYVHDGSNTTSDSFIFKVADGMPNELTGQTFNITIRAIDDETQTIATNNGLTLNEGATKSITLSELEANDIDTDNSTLTYTLTTGLSNGQLEHTDNIGVSIQSFTQQMLIDGRIRYVHDGSETTNDSFIFKVADGTPNELTNQSFNITITAVNDVPTAAVHTFTTNEDTAITDGDLTAYATDAEGDTLTYTLEDNATNGTLALNGNGSFTYTPDENYNGTDSFTWKVSDGTDTSNTATATITINAVNDAPSAPTIESITASDSQVIITWSKAIGATSYKIHYEPQSRTDSAIDTVIDDGSNTYTYTAESLENGVTYYFKVKAVNGGGESPYSEEKSATPQVPAPGIPTLQLKTIGNSRVTIQWSQIDEATGYKVYQGTESQSYTEVRTVSGITCTIDGLTNSMTYYFAVKAINPGGDSNYSNEIIATPRRSSNNDDDDDDDDNKTDTNINVQINGKTETAATATTTQQDGKTVTTITIDDEKIEEKLQQEGNNATVSIPVSGQTDEVVGSLNGQTVKSMEAKEAVLEIKTDNVTYTLPASQLNIDNVSSQMGTEVELKDIKVNITVSEPPQDTVKIIEDTASKNNYQMVVKPVEFNITCTNDDKAVEVNKFKGYVNRTVAIPDDINPNKITTGIVLNDDGTFSHVPTTIVEIDGKYYAKINSLTNSAYSVIYSPKTFDDVESHWAKKAINDMASRLIINGMGNGSYEPERKITRAEFSAIMVKGLGLMRPGTGKDTFADVSKEAWYYDAVFIAYENGLISGYENGVFKPMDRITREQAMTMIARAMKLTGLETELSEAEIQNLLQNYQDNEASSQWAQSSIAGCIRKGIITGKGNNTLAPKDEISRAEVAVIMRRLLQKSELI